MKQNKKTGLKLPPGPVYIVNVRAPEEIGKAYSRFCKEQGSGPSSLLSQFMQAFGRAQLLSEKAKAKKIGKAEALREMGQLIANLETTANINGHFRELATKVLESQGQSLEELDLKI